MKEDIKKWVESLIKPKLILVVDDDPMIRMTFECTAAAFNVNMDLAKSAEEAIKLLQDKTYDFIFLDLKLENQRSGMDVLKFVSSVNPTMNVILLSGNVTLNDAFQDAMSLGVLSFINKPSMFTVPYLCGAFKKIGLPLSGDPPLSPTDVYDKYFS